MNLHAFILSVTAASVLSASQQAHALTFTFEGGAYIAPGTARIEHSYWEWGTWFTAIPEYLDATFTRCGGGFPGRAENGTAYLLFAAFDSLSAHKSGARFRMVSVDLAEYSTVFPYPKSISFIGYKFDNNIVTNTFTTDGIIDGMGPLEDFQTFYFDDHFADIVRFEVADNGYALDNLVTADLSRPAIDIHPASQSLRPECQARFSVSFVGTAPVVWWWQKDGHIIPGTQSQGGGLPYRDFWTNSVLTVDRVSSADFGSYALVVSNAYGATTSRVAVLSLDRLPVVEGPILQRYPTGGLKIPTSSLLAQASDPDGDSLRIVSVDSRSVAGGTILGQLTNQYLYYIPPPGFTNADSFSYSVTDGHCRGVTSATVLLEVRTDIDPRARATIVIQDSGHPRVTFEGVPGYAYQVQSSDSLSLPEWRDRTNLTADIFGTVEFVDNSSTNVPSRFYRALVVGE